MTETRYPLYVSAVEGHPFLRPGTGGRVHIGALRSGRAFIFDTARIFPITDEELRSFRRDYDAALRLGDLKERSHDEWLGYQAAQRDADKAHAAKLEQDAKERAAQAAKLQKEAEAEAAQAAAEAKAAETPSN